VYDSRWHWNFFIDNPSGCTLAPRSTQPLKEMSMGGVVVGKGSWHVGPTSSPTSYAKCSKNLEIEPLVTLWAYNRPVHGLLYLYLVL